MVLHCIANHRMVLDGIALNLIVLHGIALDIIIFHGIAWYCNCMVLHSFNGRSIGLYLARHLSTTLQILICFTHLQYDKLWGLARRVFTLFYHHIKSLILYQFSSQ